MNPCDSRTTDLPQGSDRVGSAENGSHQSEEGKNDVKFRRMFDKYYSELETQPEEKKVEE